MKAPRTIDPGPRIISDADVISKVLNGEKELFEILMRRYNQKLYRVVRSYLREEEDVEDAMQEAYVKAYVKLDQFKGTASFSTWLIRIGINEALSKHRKKGRVVEFFSEQEIKNQGGKQIVVEDNKQLNPEARLIQKEMKMILEVSIDTLPDKYRTPYVMKEVEGMSNPEISACLNLTESNVKVRVHRAKSLLKDSIYKLTTDSDLFEFGNSRCDRMVESVMGRI